MIVKQLSVFLENEAGRLNEVTALLAEANINISAFSVADTTEFGILRLIVSDPEKAFNDLKSAGFTVRLSEVICLVCPNIPGALAKTLQILSQENIFIEYLYAFSMDKDSANIVLKAGDIHRCIEVLKAHQMELRDANDLYRF